MPISFHHTDSHGTDTTALTNAFTFAQQLVQLSNTNQIFIVVHTKDNLKSEIFNDVFGQKNIRSLLSGNVVINNCTIYLRTEKINPNEFIDGPILAVYISPKFLETISDSRATDIIFVPWKSEELDIFLVNHPNSNKI